MKISIIKLTDVVLLILSVLVVYVAAYAAGPLGAVIAAAGCAFLNAAWCALSSIACDIHEIKGRIK